MVLHNITFFKEINGLYSKMGTEFIGTFLLCFTVALTAGKSSMAALAIGTVLSVAVYGGGYISGGHYNPAVTLGALFCGKIDVPHSILNMLSQFIGAYAAGLTALYMLGEGNVGYPAVGEAFASKDAICVEAVCTTFLVLVVLGSACSKDTSGKDFYGYAIGMTVFSCAVSSGRVSGGAFNPAVGILGAAADGAYDDLNVYMIGPFLGSFIAAILYRLITPLDISPQAPAGEGKSFFSNYNILERPDLAVDSIKYTITNKVVCELTGTFFLTYTVGMCDGSKPLAALAIGTSLATSIYGLGFVSGGHFNPAVTVGVHVHKKLANSDYAYPVREMLLYILAQTIGACLAAGIASNVSDIAVGTPMPGVDSNDVEYSKLVTILAEIIATATLVYTVLNCCFSKVSNNNYFGYCIGSVVFVMATAVGPISGGGFNPAVCTACLFVNHTTTNLWVYWVAPILGGILAGGIYHSTHFKFEVAEANASSTAPVAATANKAASSKAADSKAADAVPAADAGSML
jgi:aquaporin Z